MINFSSILTDVIDRRRQRLNVDADVRYVDFTRMITSVLAGAVIRGQLRLTASARMPY